MESDHGGFTPGSDDVGDEVGGFLGGTGRERHAQAQKAGLRITRGTLAPLVALLCGLTLFAAVAGALQTRDLDIAVYWQTAQRTFVEGSNPYVRRAGDVLPFTYPPTALFLVYPLSLLDLKQAGQLVWRLNLLLVPALMLLLIHDLSRDDPAAARNRRLQIWGPLYMAGFGGIYLTLHFHQVNLLILLCLWLYWRQLRRGRCGFGGGAALVLGAVAKPHYGLLLLGALPQCAQGRAWGRCLRLMLGVAIAGFALLVLSLVLAPGSSWASWWNGIAGTASYTALPDGHSSIAAPWNRSIAGQVARFLIPNKFTEPVMANPAAAATLSSALVVLLLSVTLWTLLGSMRRRFGAGSADPTAIDLELSLLSVFIFLAAPASWTHHLVMLLPAALVLLRDAVLDPREPMGSRLTAALVLSVLALTLDDLLPRDTRTASQALMGLMTVAVVCLWLLLLERLNRRARHAAPAREAP
jgi:hypothetical protein